MYKKVGPAWIEMEKNSIKEEVNGRINLLNKNLKNLETEIKQNQTKALEARKNMIRIEQEFKAAIVKAQNN